MYNDSACNFISDSISITALVSSELCYKCLEPNKMPSFRSAARLSTLNIKVLRARRP